MSYEAFRFHGPVDEQRRLMPPQVAQDIMATINTEPLADEERLKTLVESFKQPTRLDGWATTKAFVDCLRGDAYHLYWDDHGLQRPCLGTEHAAVVFDGSEIDYLPAFYETPGEAAPPEVLQIKRITDEVQDDGKVLSIAQTGNNYAQARFNRLTTANFLRSMQLPRAVKQAVALLADANIIGGMLQDFDVSAELARFQRRWPPEFRDYRDDLLLASYLSDASAHSGHRLMRNARTGFIEPAVRPEHPQLSSLFVRHPSGALTLTSELTALVLERLPGIKYLRYLLVDGSPASSLAPYAREDSVFADVVARRLASGRQRRGITKKDGLRTDVISFVGNGRAVDRYGQHVRVNTYMQGTPHISTETMYWLPGDGRLWRRSVHVGNLALAYDIADYYAPPASYQHADPTVRAMQLRVAQAALPEPRTVGYPLPVTDAWEVINRMEKL